MAFTTRATPAPKQFPYDNAIEDMTHHLQVREREFASLDIPADPHQLEVIPPLLVTGTAVNKWRMAPSISGAAGMRQANSISWTTTTSASTGGAGKRG